MASDALLARYLDEWAEQSYPVLKTGVEIWVSGTEAAPANGHIQGTVDWPTWSPGVSPQRQVHSWPWLM